MDDDKPCSLNDAVSPVWVAIASKNRSELT
jgi:hypothetical protein